MTDQVPTISVELPSMDWVILLHLVADNMKHMTPEQKAFCLQFAGQVRYQTTDQAYDTLNSITEKT